MVFKIVLSLWRRAHSSSTFATFARMEGGWFSKWGSRPGAAHICNSYTDGGRLAFKMGLSPWRRAHSSEKSSQQLHGWRAVPFQNVALALALQAFVHHKRMSLK